MERQFKSDEGRRHFATWLFRLADEDQNEKITASGLHSLIEAIQRDEVILDDFPHPNTNQCVTDILHHLDVSDRGYLDRDEFSILADMIIQHYKKKSQEWHVGTQNLPKCQFLRCDAHFES